MHGLTGGSWKRSAEPATDAEKNNPGGKPRGAPGSTTYHRSTPPRQLPTLHQESTLSEPHVDTLTARPGFFIAATGVGTNYRVVFSIMASSW